jgi:hypothetical protein
MINLSLLYSVRMYQIDRRENLLLTTSLCAEQMEFEKPAFCKAFFFILPFSDLQQVLLKGFEQVK